MAVVDIKGKPLELQEFKPMVTPPVANSLKELIQGARNISRIGLNRIPTPAEMLLLNEWLETASRMLEDRRYRNG